MKKIVLVDVDETVVCNYSEWKEWYKEETGAEIDFNNNETVQEALLTHRVDPLGFWKQRDLYDGREPIDKSLEVITKYKDKFDFVFCSNCFSQHMDSKTKFLRKYFGNLPFISTSAKEYVKCDIVIDDRHAYIDSIISKQPNVVGIQVKAPYNREHKGVHYFDWDEIDSFLSNYEV